MTIEIAQTIDTKGTRCPIPILRTKQALKKIQFNEYLQVLATDPSTKGDMDAMLHHVAHQLVSYQVLTENEEDVFVFVIQKRA